MKPLEAGKYQSRSTSGQPALQYYFRAGRTRKDLADKLSRSIGSDTFVYIQIRVSETLDASHGGAARDRKLLVWLGGPAPTPPDIGHARTHADQTHTTNSEQLSKCTGMSA